jgi:hypothetical protein
MLDVWRNFPALAAPDHCRRSSHKLKAASTRSTALLKPFQQTSASCFSPQLRRGWIGTLRDDGRVAVASRS